MATPVHTTRRLFLVGAPAMVCGACGHTYVTDVATVVRTSMMKGDDLHLTRTDIDRIPYASVAIRMGDGPQALLVLGRYDGDKLDWISAEHEVITTRRGRVVKTVGLPQDLKETIFLTADPVGRPSAAVAQAQQCVRTVDLEPGHRDGVLVSSRFEKTGDETIDILGERVATELWQEHGAAPQLGWDYVNLYWIDASSGYVWKSRQTAAPSLPPLEIIVYRRAA
jgi:hypothetical protein